jgi:hypothetical protein
VDGILPVFWEWTIQPARARSSSEIRDVNVISQPHVVGEVPANVVIVLINYDLVGIPQPAISEAKIVWGNAEEEAVKPEALRASAYETEYMAMAKAARKVPMLPGMIEMVVGIITTRVMPDPVAVGVNVLGISSVVIECAVWLTSKGSWTMGRDESAPPTMTASAVSLCESGKRQRQQHYKKCAILFHVSS